jgi:hypothetical protein
MCVDPESVISEARRRMEMADITTGEHRLRAECHLSECFRPIRFSRPGAACQSRFEPVVIRSRGAQAPALKNFRFRTGKGRTPMVFLLQSSTEPPRNNGKRVGPPRRCVSATRRSVVMPRVCSCSGCTVTSGCCSYLSLSLRSRERYAL